MGFFSAVKKFFSGGSSDDAKKAPQSSEVKAPEAQAPAEAPAEPEAEEPAAPAVSEPEVPVEAVSVEPEAASEAPAEVPVPVEAPVAEVPAQPAAKPAMSSEEAAMAQALRQAEPRLSAWLAIILEGVEEADGLLWDRLGFLLRALETPQAEADAFLDDFRGWLKRMDYRWLDDFRSELQYRLALALDMEDEEDERDRLFVKLKDGLARTRERFSQSLEALFSGHTELTPAFWEEMEELFIMADMGAEPSFALVKKLKERARAAGVATPDALMPILEEEVEAIFKTPRRIAVSDTPEVILMVGVNGVGKTTTIAKLAYRARMQGKKVLIAAADTFRAAAVEQLEVWAQRIGADFHAKGTGADPAAVAF